MTYLEALDWAKAKDATLLATDFTSDCVIMLMEDGSYFHWENAFLAPIYDKFVAVFTEHYGFHVFAKDDILNCKQMTFTGR